MKKVSQNLVPIEGVIPKIRLLRAQKVLLDSDLAELYGVPTGQLNRAVKRNLRRFPAGFMFQLSRAESESLRCQIGISNRPRGGRRYLPYAFTEQGVAMLSSVLNSERAIQVNIAVMRAFVKIREILGSNEKLARQFEEMQARLGIHDEQIQDILAAIQEMLEPPLPAHRRQIGFHTKE